MKQEKYVVMKTEYFLALKNFKPTYRMEKEPKRSFFGQVEKRSKPRKSREKVMKSDMPIGFEDDDIWACDYLQFHFAI